MLALDAQRQALWIAQFSSEVLAPPQMRNGIVVARSGDGRIFGLDADDGTRKWVYQRSHAGADRAQLRRAAASSRAGVFAGFPGGRLVALQSDSGALGWEATVALPRGATELERVADVIEPPGRRREAGLRGRVPGPRRAASTLRNGTPLWARDVSSIAGLADRSAQRLTSPTTRAR